jgi:hypothetical protein
VEVADRDSEEAKDSGDGRSGSGGGWPEWISARLHSRNSRLNTDVETCDCGIEETRR